MSTPLIEVRSIVKKFGNKAALDGVSLSIEPGEIFGLLGPNGAGKTTLSSLIGTVRPPTSGDILFQGRSIYENIPLYRQQIGYCAQRPNLNSDINLYKNLEFAGRYFGLSDQMIQERIEQLSEYFGLKNYLYAYPRSLSGGYKQRFMIARTIIHRPKLLLLDEPTVALDPHVRIQLWDYIKKLQADGMTILLTTHYLDEAEFLSSRVCILDKGHMRLIDTPQNLMATFAKKRLEDVFVQLMQDQQ